MAGLREGTTVFILIINHDISQQQDTNNPFFSAPDSVPGMDGAIKTQGKAIKTLLDGNNMHWSVVLGKSMCLTACV